MLTVNINHTKATTIFIQVEQVPSSNYIFNREIVKATVVGIVKIMWLYSPLWPVKACSKPPTYMFSIYHTLNDFLPL